MVFTVLYMKRDCFYVFYGTLSRKFTFEVTLTDN